VKTPPPSLFILYRLAATVAAHSLGISLARSTHSSISTGASALRQLGSNQRATASSNRQRLARGQQSRHRCPYAMGGLKPGADRTLVSNRALVSNPILAAACINLMFLNGRLAAPLRIILTARHRQDNEIQSITGIPKIWGSSNAWLGKARHSRFDNVR